MTPYHRLSQIHIHLNSSGLDQAGVALGNVLILCYHKLQQAEMACQQLQGGVAPIAGGYLHICNGSMGAERYARVIRSNTGFHWYRKL